MSVREIQPGVWDVQVYGKRRSDGTRPRETRRVHGTKTDAGNVEADLKAKRNRGEPFGPTDTLAAYLAVWLDSREADIAAQTHYNYDRTAKLYILPHLGRLKLAEVTPKDVRRMDRELAAAGLSGSTRLYAYRVLSMVMRQAVQDREIAFSPMDSVKPPKSTSPEPPALEAAEVVELLTKLQGTALYAPAILAYDAGLRREELLGLHWADVDTDAGTVRIAWAAEQVNGQVRLKEPKTPRSKRVVAISAPAVAALKEHRAAQLRERVKEPGLWRDEDLCFPSVYYHDREHPKGRVWTPYAFSKAWRLALDDVNGRRLAEHVKAGGEVADFEPWAFGVHILRHTFVTHQLQAGTRLEVVSRAAGHGDSGVTLKRYSHVLAGEDAATREVTGALLGQLASDDA